MNRGGQIFIFMLAAFGALFLVAGSLFLFIRRALGRAKTQQASWGDTGEKLGLAVDPSSSGMYKAFYGERHGVRFTLTRYTVTRGGGETRPTHINHVQVQTLLPVELPFPVELSKPETLIESAGLLMNPSPFEQLNRSFQIACSDHAALSRLLAAGTNQIADGLVRAAESSARVKLRNRELLIGMRVEPGDSETISGLIERCVRLARDIEKARCSAFAT